MASSYFWEDSVKVCRSSSAGLFRLWVGELTGTDVRDLSDASCKLINMLGYSASDLSAWLIIAVTFERCAALQHNEKNNRTV